MQRVPQTAMFSEAQRKPNKCWTNWGICGIVLGIILLLLGLAMIPVEVSRIIQGSLNRGKKGSFYLYPNYNSILNANSDQIKAFLPDYYEDNNGDLAAKGIVPFSATVPNGVNKQGGNFPIQDKYLWPWSHAALLFSLVTIAAGALGIMSGCRKTYSTLYAFFALAVLNGFLAAFLIAYYAVHVYYNNNYNQTWVNASYFSSVDASLGKTMLALSCASCFFSIVATIASCLGAGVCGAPKAKLLPIGAAGARRPGGGPFGNFNLGNLNPFNAFR